MIGVDLVADRGSRQPAQGLAQRVMGEALRRGWILLAGGAAGNVLSLTPPLNIDRRLLKRAVDMLESVLASLASH